MLDFLFQSGWGAFAMLLALEIPFVAVFLYVVFRKSYFDPNPSDTKKSVIARMEGVWITGVIAIFITINVVSIQYMPPVMAAQMDKENAQQVDVVARSWSFEISDREYEVGQTVRFSIKSADTMHGFAVYHPDGRLLFTTMLVPGLLKPTGVYYKFTEPGKYKVRCLEYCGLAHHAMQDELTVVKGNI